MADEQPKSIGDSIREAFNEVEPEDDSAPARPAPRPAPEEPERDELSEGIERQPRDPTTGRFVRDDGSEPEEPPAKPAPQPKPEGEPQPEQPAPPVQEPPKEQETREQRLAKMTANWRAEHKEFLARQSPEVQDFLVGRQAEMDVAYGRKSQALAYLQNEYGPVHQMLAPDLPAIRAAGYTPRMLIEGWANAERSLLSGPQNAAVTLRNIAEGYQIPRQLVAQAFGFDPRTPDEIRAAAPGAPAAPEAQPGGEVIPPNANGHANEFRDPRVDVILADQQERHERAVIQQQQQFRQRANVAMAQIAEFRDARDAKGNLMHPYFAEVEGHMTALAKFHGENTGTVPALKDLYDSAVNANPATRAKVAADAARLSQERQRQAEAARGKADQARRASSSIVGSGRPNQRPLTKAPPKGASIRASIDAALEEHDAAQD